MGITTARFQLIVTAFFALVGYSIPLHANDVTERLLSELGAASEGESRRIERDIKSEWSKSGSAAMDLLLRRGEEALENEDTKAAIEHFTALTDHAPDFAEGWHGLAQAYFRAGLFGPALDSLERTLSLNPVQFDAIFGLGALLQDFGDFVRAERAYREVLRLHPHHEEAKDALERLKRLGIGRTL